MKMYQETWISRNYIKAAIVYISTISAALTVRANTVQQSLPLVEEIEVGRFNLSSDIQDFVVQNNTAFIAAGNRGFYVVDVSDEVNIVVLKNYQTEGYVHQVSVINNYLYVAEDTAGLKIYNISDYTDPSSVGVYVISHNLKLLPINKVAVGGEHAFIANTESSEFDLVDISIPQQVHHVYLETPAPALTIAISNGIAFVGVRSRIGSPDNYVGIYSINVTNPDHPQFLDSIILPVIAISDITVSGTVVYASSDVGLHTLNVSTPSKMQLLSNFPVGQVYRLSVVANIAYMTVLDRSLYIINVTLPSNPQLIKVYALSSSYPISGLAVSGSIAYVAMSFNDIFIINVTNPGVPQILGGLTTSTIVTQVSIANDRLYLTLITNSVDVQATLYVLNVANLNNIQPLNSTNLLGGCAGIDIVDALVYLACGSQGLYLIDTSDPTAFSVITNYHTTYANRVRVFDSVAYIADTTTGLSVIDTTRVPQTYQGITSHKTQQLIDVDAYKEHILFTEQSRLTIIDTQQFISSWSIEVFDIVETVHVMGNIAYIVAQHKGLLAFNITDLTNPQLVGTYNQFQFDSKSLAISGTLAYFISGIDTDKKFLIIDIANPRNMQLLYTYDPSYNIGGVCVNAQSSRAYISTGNALMIFDVTIPSSSRVLGNYPLSGAVISLVVNSNLIYLVEIFLSGPDYLRIIDVSSSNNPVLLNSYSFPDARGVAIYNGLAYISTSNRLELIDVSDVLNLQWLGGCNLPNQVLHVAVTDTLALVATYQNGVNLLEIGDPTHPYLLQNYNTRGGSLDVVFYEDKAFVADGPTGVQVINLSPLQNYFLTESLASQIATFNDITYVTDSARNLYAVNISDINNLKELSCYSLPFHAIDMVADNEYLYISEGFEGVEIFDISNSTNPRFAARITAGLTNAKSVKVENNKLYVINNYKDVIIFDIKPKYYLSGQMEIREGEKHMITPSDVATIGFNGSSPSQLEMTAGNLSHAHFELAAQPGISITSYTLEQVQNNQIFFVHDGSESAPSFSLTITDGTTTKGPLTANIIYQAINDPPVLENHFILISEGEAVTITTANLSASDVESSAQKLIFIVIQQSHSQFERTSNPGVVATRFTQSEVMQGEIQFLHLSQNDDKDFTPYFLVRVSDGTAESEVMPAQIDYNAAPKLIHNQLDIYRGQSLTITSNELQASDRDDAAESLTFIISNIQHGTISKTIFKQAEITQGTIQFQHDNSEQAPSYEISIKDKRMQTANQTVRVTFSNKNPTIAFDTLGISLTATGGAVGLALVGIGIFAYRNYARNKNSRKQDPFASAIYNVLKPVDTADFNSPQGQRFVQGIQALKAELSKQCIDVDRMGSWEISQLAEQTNLAIQSEISKNVNWRGESVVDGHDIQRYAVRLALAIQKIRAGVYDTSLYSAI